MAMSEVPPRDIAPAMSATAGHHGVKMVASGTGVVVPQVHPKVHLR